MRGTYGSLLSSFSLRVHGLSHIFHRWRRRSRLGGCGAGCESEREIGFAVISSGKEMVFAMFVSSVPFSAKGRGLGQIDSRRYRGSNHLRERRGQLQ